LGPIPNPQSPIPNPQSPYNFKIEHEDYNYDRFINLLKNNKYDKINMDLRKYQRYYIRFLFDNKEIFDKNDAINSILKKFGDNIKIKLTDNDISYKKS